MLLPWVPGDGTKRHTTTLSVNWRDLEPRNKHFTLHLTKVPNLLKYILPLNRVIFN